MEMRIAQQFVRKYAYRMINDGGYRLVNAKYMWRVR